MRPSPLLLALAVLAAACGGNSAPPAATKCPQKPCATGLTCQSDGTCAITIATPDAGIAACTNGEVKPVGDSSLAQAGSQLAGAAYVLKREPHTVGDLMTFEVPAGTASVTIVEQAVSAPDTATFISGGSALLLDNTANPHTIVSQDGSINFNDIINGQTLTPTNQDAATYYTQMPVYFFSDSPATGTLTVPNTTRGLSFVGANGLPSGTWTAQISDYAYECAKGIGAPELFQSCSLGSTTSTYDVTVILKPTTSGGGIPPSGTVKVMLNFVATSAAADGAPPTPLNAAGAPSDQDVIRLVSTLTGLYAKQNIAVNIDYQDAPVALQQKFSTGVNIDQTGACSDLSQLLIDGAPGNVVNIFLVPSLNETTSGGGQQPVTVGIDGTIPGPASIPGTVASGAVVSVADLRSRRSQCISGSVDVFGCGADETAYIVAHEVGHFLGLYHVTEKYGFEFDPLADTLPCKCTSCSRTPSTCFDPRSPSAPSTSNDSMDVSECSNAATGCGGGDNLMFWLLATGSVGNLTPQQGQVMRANPAVQ